jgi:hypothetical protein
VDPSFKEPGATKNIENNRKQSKTSLDIFRWTIYIYLIYI